MATVLGLFAALFVTIGAVTVTGASSAGLVVIAVIAFVVGAALALTAWGLVASVRRDTAERRVDAAVAAALAAAGTSIGCGHDHDPDELQVTDETCAHDGTGLECSHSCETCVLAAHRR
jgi:hypothetical protein